MARLNAHGEYAGGAQRLVPLDRDQLVDRARDAAGLHDLDGDEGDGWWANYDALLDGLDREWRGHVVGRTLTRAEILRSLQTRLEVVAAVDRQPDLFARPVAEPLFIVGAARSGTSILHELLCLDPTALVPTTWRVHRPADGFDTDRAEAARREVDAVVQSWHDVQPEYEAMHHNGGDLPTECIFLTAPTFLSDAWAGPHTSVSYAAHVALADHEPAYRWHRRTLQLLQAAEPATGSSRRWVLKAPSHLATLRALFAVYPDARVVHIHRDPARTLPSMFDLMATLKWMRSDHVDIAGLVAMATDGIAELQEAAIAGRAAGVLPDDRFCDVRYADLMADPTATVARIHERFGWPTPPGIADDVRSYLAAKPKGARGTHRYSLATFGLTADAVAARYRDYLERFDIPAERDG